MPSSVLLAELTQLPVLANGSDCVTVCLLFLVYVSLQQLTVMFLHAGQFQCFSGTGTRYCFRKCARTNANAINDTCVATHTGLGSLAKTTRI